MTQGRRVWSRLSAGFQVAGRRAALVTAAALAILLSIATIAGLVRVLPWLVAPNIPWRVALPFARALFGVALETSLLCALPVGWALSSSWLVERGEARALFSMGHSPARIVGLTLPVAVAFAALAAVVALVGGIDAAAPGRLARSLVNESKQSCQADRASRPADVPFVGVTWLCFSGAPARLVGELPGRAGVLTAADIDVSDDLRSLRFSDMQLLLVRDTGHIRVKVSDAHIIGLSPWGRASNLPAGVRALLLSSTGAGLALLSAWSVLAAGVSRRLFSLLIGGAGPAAALLVLSGLERADHRISLYFAVPAAGLLGLALAVFAVRAAARRTTT